MAKNITKKQLKNLRKLNDKLSTLQNKLVNEMISLDKILRKRVKNKKDPLDDYEIDLKLTFILNEDDKNYNENEDNIITVINEYEKGISKQNKKKDRRYKGNHNDFMFWESHPMRGEYHCWWFHCLYDHNNLSFEDMLKIGTIWSDIEVQYQYIDTINFKSKKEK